MVSAVNGAAIALPGLRTNPAGSGQGAASDQARANPLLQADRRTQERLQQTRQAIQTLKISKRLGSNTSKNVAKQKLDQLKAELRNLQLLGGDPKARAKRIAQIAKEIGEAARAYAAAGGSASEAASAAGAGASAAQSGATPTEGADAQGSADGEGAQAQAQAAEANASQAAEADAAEADASQAKNAARSAETASSADKAQETNANRSQAQGQNAPNDANSADKDFINEARNLLALAKAALKRAIEEARRKGLKPDEDGDSVEKAEREVAKAAADLDKASGAEPAAAYDASAQAVPASAPANVAVTA